MLECWNSVDLTGNQYLISFLLMLAANIVSGLLLSVIGNRKPRTRGKHEKQG